MYIYIFYWERDSDQFFYISNEDRKEDRDRSMQFKKPLIKSQKNLVPVTWGMILEKPCYLDNFLFDKKGKMVTFLFTA